MSRILNFTGVCLHVNTNKKTLNVQNTYVISISCRTTSCRWNIFNPHSRSPWSAPKRVSWLCQCQNVLRFLSLLVVQRTSTPLVHAIKIHIAPSRWRANICPITTLLAVKNKKTNQKWKCCVRLEKSALWANAVIPHRRYLNPNQTQRFSTLA